MEGELRWSYRELESVLAGLHRISPDQRIALQGRIKHFQRNGWPGGTNTGKGRAATYDIGAVLRLAIGFELLQIGLTPERAVSLLRANWDYVATALSLAFNRNEAEARTFFDVVLYCDPLALSYLQDKAADEDPSNETFFYNSTIQMGRQLLANPTINARRLAMVNLSSLLSDLANNVGDWATLYDAYIEWDESERQTDNAHSADIPARVAEIEKALSKATNEQDALSGIDLLLGAPRPNDRPSSSTLPPSEE